ncbi:MAG: hypothetical protein HOO97_05045, partial [Sideroxydans sp.]|nr:hypothetical protein [Sideroxydans sp.]
GSPNTNNSNNNQSQNIPNASVKLVKGVAAAGAPVASGIGYALDAATGTQVAFVTGADGSYTADLTGLTGPFLIHVRGITKGGAPVDLYSLASSVNFGGTVNVTPLSDVVVGYAAGMRTDKLEAACTANQAACPALFNGIVANLALSSSNIVSALPASVLSAFSVDQASFNAITTPFSANHTGADALLDALQVVPPAAGVTNGNYSINLNGATAVPLITVPVTTSVTATAPSTNVTAPTTQEVTRAANLTKALAEVETFFTNFNDLFVTSLPSSTQVDPFVDATFLSNGVNKANHLTGILTGPNARPVGTKFVSGGLAPYSGAPYTGVSPGASVVFDANNCVTSMWVYFGVNGLVRDTVLLKNSIPGTNVAGVCTGGTWTLAGNQRAYTSRVTSIFMRFNFGAQTMSKTGFQLETSSAETTSNTSTPVAVPYASVTFSGPGITTLGNPNGSNGTVTLIGAYTPSIHTNNTIDDPYYGSTSNFNPYYPGQLEGSNTLRDCAQMSTTQNNGGWNVTPTNSTPCLNMAAVVAGGDYTIKFYSGLNATGTLLETDMQRLDVAPTSIPSSWFSTINSVTPAGGSMTAAGGTVTASWTLANGAVSNYLSLNINDINISTLMNAGIMIAPSATAGSVVVPSLPAVPNPNPNSLTGLPISKTPSTPGSSYAFVMTAVAGVMVMSAVDY